MRALQRGLHECEQRQHPLHVQAWASGPLSASAFFVAEVREMLTELTVSNSSRVVQVVQAEVPLHSVRHDVRPRAPVRVLGGGVDAAWGSNVIKQVQDFKGGFVALCPTYTAGK